jgi:hypothetical protein
MTCDKNSQVMANILIFLGYNVVILTHLISSR